MVAQPSTPVYGRLVMLQYYLAMEYLINCSAVEAFDPAPVNLFLCALVHMLTYHLLPKIPPYFASISFAFGQRRKTLRNTLFVDDAGFCCPGINPQLRAENLSVAEFVTIITILAATMLANRLFDIYTFPNSLT
jgi:16S rRNA (adenine1518-N6/adenine1519-N6)-dimethyltransferase